MSETPTYEDGWLPISSAPNDPDWYCDLPGDASDGCGYAVSDETGNMLFLVWFEQKNAAVSKAVLWRPLPAGPALSSPAPTEEG